MEKGTYEQLLQAYLQIRDSIVLEGFYALVAGIIIAGFIFRLVEISRNMTEGKFNARAFLDMGKEYLLCIGVILLFPVLLNVTETAMAYGADKLVESLGGTYDVDNLWADPLQAQIDRVLEGELDGIFNGAGGLLGGMLGDGLLSVILGSFFAVAYEYIMLVFVCTRYLILVLLEIVSPVAIACLYNGNTRSSFFTWLKALFGCYMMYPAFIVASIFSDLVVKNYIMTTAWPMTLMVIFSFLLKTTLLASAKSTINRWL